MLFLCAAVAALGETMLQAAASVAIGALHRQGVAVAAAELSDAQARAQSSIAASVMQGAPLPSLIPSPTPTCVLARETTDCALIASESIAIETPQATSCPSGGCGAYAQENDLVAEGRAVAEIEARVTTSSGDLIAARDERVVFRTLRIAPYALVVGAGDATLDDDESGPGDLNGMPPGASSNGTLINVIYQNATSGAILPANVWTPVAPGVPGASDWSP